VTSLRDVSERIGQEGLAPPVLPFLSTTPGLFRVLLFQPQGVIVATDTSVRVRDRDLLARQMNAFLRHASALSVDLAACPEYSCPWISLREAIIDGTVPAEGKIWAVSCESISRAELHSVIDELTPHCRIVLDWPPASANGEFLDCVCFLFIARDAAGAEVTTMLVQFKTCQMGGETYESEHLILGETIYRFGDAGTNRLVGLLCSDSLSQKFMDDVVPELRHDTLVLHLQLNPHGENARFRAYRDACCNEKPRNSEVLCLNWAKGTQLQTDEAGVLKDVDLIVEPRTILFRPDEELDATDDQVVKNHKRGCYLTYLKSYRTAAYVFSPDSQLFAFKTSKPMIVGAGSIAIRSGIIMDGRYEWTGNDWGRAAADAKDRFEEYWSKDAPRLEPYLTQMRQAPLDGERLIQLSTGRGVEPRLDDWKSLGSFRLCNDDTACRLQLCWSTKGEGYDYRASCRADFLGFVFAVENAANFSPRLTAFKENEYTIGYRSSPGLHHRNLHIQGGPSATAVFLGMAPASEKLSRVKSELLKRIADVAQDQELIAIWYRDEAGELKDHMDQQTPAIFDDPRRNPVGIDDVTP